MIRTWTFLGAIVQPTTPHLCLQLPVPGSSLPSHSALQLNLWLFSQFLEHTTLPVTTGLFQILDIKWASEREKEFQFPEELGVRRRGAKLGTFWVESPQENTSGCGTFKEPFWRTKPLTEVINTLSPL